VRVQLRIFLTRVILINIGSVSMKVNLLLTRCHT